MKRKQMSAVMLGLGWLASLGAVFILGILSAFAFHLGPGAAGTGNSDLTLEQRELMLVLERYTGQPADIATIMSVGSGEDLPEQVEQALRAIMRNPDPETRQMDARRLVRGLPSRRVMAGIKFIQEIPADPGRDQVLGCLLEAWAEEDGRRAVAFAASLNSPSERELAIRSVLRGWSKEQPADAWLWVREQAGNSRRSERWLEVIVSSLTAASRGTAFNLLERMPDTDFRNRMGMVVMEQVLANETPREAINWLGEFPATARPLAAVTLAQTWAATEPEAAASWIHQAFPREIDGLGQVLAEWTYTDPVAAADWTWRTFSGSLRSELLDILSAEWVANDGPAPLADWLNEQAADPTLDGAIRNLALNTAAYDPATALVWAQSVYDPDTRSMLEIYIGQQWIRQNPDEAAASLPGLLESESARAALLAPVEEEYYEEPVPVSEEEMVTAEPGEPVQ